MAKKREQKIENFLQRGVEKIFPSREFLRERLLEGKSLKMYLGIDPTGPSLHLGHMAILLKLREFQNLGHKVILLIGDFTATIGDPTGKDRARKSLSREEVLENGKKYKEQAGRIISFEGENPAELDYNSKWLSKMTLEEILEGLSNITVDQILKREMFQERQKRGNPIYIHEFLYPFMQGIDSVFLEIDGEIGGNDQTFNMLVGRDLMKTIQQKEKFVIAIKLLTDSTGRKMGKSESNLISLDQSPEKMYGAVMSLSDDLIIPGLELLTTKDMKKIKEHQSKIENGKNPKEIKSILAEEIVRINYGKEQAEKSKNSFESVFSGEGLPDNPEEISLEDQEILSEALVRNNIVESKSQFKRLVEEGGIRNAETGENIKDFNHIPKKGDILKIGKKRFVKII